MLSWLRSFSLSRFQIMISYNNIDFWYDKCIIAYVHMHATYSTYVPGINIHMSGVDIGICWILDALEVSNPFVPNHQLNKTQGRTDIFGQGHMCPSTTTEAGSEAMLFRSGNLLNLAPWLLGCSIVWPNAPPRPPTMCPFQKPPAMQVGFVGVWFRLEVPTRCPFRMRELHHHFCRIVPSISLLHL